MKKLFIQLFLLLPLVAIGQGIFEKPVLIEAGGAPLDLSSHTSALIYDFNHDGVKDLLVGEFGDIPLEGMLDDPVYGNFMQGRCRIYINHGSHEKPVYSNYEWLMAGDKPAFVPITCCIGFTPRIKDLDGDGVDDVLTGSYPGELYFFKGLGKKRFSLPEVIMDEQGDSLNVAHSTVVEPFDYDNDGDLDLLISTRMDGTFLSVNIGSCSNPIFKKGVKLNLPQYDYIYAPLKEPRKSRVSHAHPVDWDNDSLFDLVCGTEEGHLVWYKNSGTKKKPEFLKAETLFTSQGGWGNVEGEPLIPLGVRCKVYAHDYNLDGKMDLIVGDFYSTSRITRDLSPAEEMEWDIAKKTSSNLLLKLKEMYPDVKQFRNVAFFNKFDGLTKKELKKVNKINRKIAEANETKAKYQKLQEHFSHGYLWLFIRK